jgi:uncharacterized membrane protein
MTRFEYIDALKQALAGLPPEVIAATVADYEQRIAAASAAGQSEEQILASLDNPQKVAAERRAARQVQAFKQEKTPVNFVRMFFSFIGLMVFNFMLIVPAIVYSALLFASFAIAIASYSGGIMMTATSLAGVNEISLDPHFYAAAHERVREKANRDDSHVIIDIGKQGNAAKNQTASQASNQASAASASSASAPVIASVGGNSSESDDFIIADENDHLGIFEDEHGVNIDMPGLHMHSPGHSHNLFFATDDFSASRPVQVSIGVGLIIGGILMFLLCLVVSKFTWIGIVRLVQMEFSVLKNA